MFARLSAKAILLAVAVLTSELGSSLSAQTPDPATEPVGGSAYAGDESDISAAGWVETGSKTVDTRKARIPPPKTTAYKPKR